MSDFKLGQGKTPIRNAASDALVEARKLVEYLEDSISNPEAVRLMSITKAYKRFLAVSTEMERLKDEVEYARNN